MSSRVEWCWYRETGVITEWVREWGKFGKRGKKQVIRYPPRRAEREARLQPSIIWFQIPGMNEFWTASLSRIFVCYIIRWMRKYSRNRWGAIPFLSLSTSLHLRSIVWYRDRFHSFNLIYTTCQKYSFKPFCAQETFFLIRAQVLKWSLAKGNSYMKSFARNSHAQKCSKQVI